MIPTGLSEKRPTLGGLVVHFLRGRPAVWIAAALISLVITIATSRLRLELSLALALVLVAASCAGIVVKDRIRARRTTRPVHRLSRRRVLAMGLSITVAASLLTTVARVFGLAMVQYSEEQFARRAQGVKRKGEK